MMGILDRKTKIKNEKEWLSGC